MTFTVLHALKSNYHFLPFYNVADYHEFVPPDSYNSVFVLRWTSDNRQVVWMDSDKQPIEGDLSLELLQSYKAPSSADSVVTQQTVGVELNQHNYVHKMHTLLQIEELTQNRIMSR